jgi:hypothetical protein
MKQMVESLHKSFRYNMNIGCLPNSADDAYPISSFAIESEISVSLIQPKGNPVSDERFNSRIPRIKK